MIDAIIGVQAFGVDHTIRPNRILSEIALNKYYSIGEDAIIVTQEDIQIEDPNIRIQRIEEELGKPPPTLRMMRFIVAKAIELGAGEIWLVCARQHLYRCERDLKKSIEERNVKINFSICEEISSYNSSDFYSLDSSQTRTQNPFNWWSREIFLITSPFWLYEKIAS